MVYLLGDIVERNISRKIILSIALVMVAISVLDFLFTFLAEIPDITNSYLLSDAFFYSLYSIPISIYEYLSYICLLGVLLGLGNMKEEGELIASRTLGKSNWNIVLAALRPVFLIILVGFIFQEAALPKISQSNEESRLIKQNKIALDEGYWFASPSAFNYFRSSPERNRVDEITIYETSNHQQIKRIISSKFAEFNDDQWIMHELMINDLGKKQISYKNSEIWLEGPSPSDMKRVLSPRYFSLNELRSALKEEISEYRANNLLLEFWRKIFHPFSTVLLILLAASFVFGNIRDDSLGTRILFGILFAFSLNILRNLFESMAVVSLLNPFNAVVIPLVFTMFVTVYFWKLKSS